MNGYLLIFWFVLFFLVNYGYSTTKLPKKELDDVKNRIISIIHGQFTLILTFYLLLIDDMKPGVVNSQR